MTTSYESSALKTEKAENQRRLDERNREVWEQILDSTDQTPGQSFFEAVVKFCGGVLTMDKYDMLCATSALPSFADKQWHFGTADFYLQKIVDKLRDRRWSEESIRDKVASLRNKTKPQIRAELQKSGFYETVGTTLEAAKDFLQRHRLDVASRQYFAPDHSGPFPRLPQNIVPPGFVTSVPLNAKYLRELASQDIVAFQRMCRMYHISQINERLRGE